MTIYFDFAAKETIGQYYENYKDVYRKTSSGKRYAQTDLNQRAYHYRQIKQVALYLNNYLGQTRIKNGKNYIRIPNIANVEYQIPNNSSLIVIKNIYFINNQVNVNNVQPNNQQKQIQYQPVSQECFGMTMVKSNNGLFNFINRNKQFSLKQWYKSAKDFAKYNSGVVAGQVFDGSVWWWVYTDRPMEQIKNNTIPESLRQMKHCLIEMLVREKINIMIREANKKILKEKNYANNNR